MCASLIVSRGARCSRDFIVKTALPGRLENERDILRRFHGHPYIRQLVDEIAEPPALVLEHLDDNLLGIEWFELFNLWNLAPVSYCRKIGNQNKESNHEESIKKLKGQFPNIFSPTLGCCNKVMVKLNLKPDAKPVT